MENQYWQGIIIAILVLIIICIFIYLLCNNRKKEYFATSETKTGSSTPLPVEGGRRMNMAPLPLSNDPGFAQMPFRN